MSSNTQAFSLADPVRFPHPLRDLVFFFASLPKLVPAISVSQVVDVPVSIRANREDLMQLLGVAEHQREERDVAEVGRKFFLDFGEKRRAC